MFTLPRRRRSSALDPADLPYVGAVAGAQVLEPAPAAMWAVYLLLAALLAAVAWAGQAQVDIVAKANARIVPDGREQVIASLEGGLLRELLVREGQQVRAGQPLALLDPTRAVAQQAEGQARRQALQATLARLQAEAGGRAPVFPAGLPAAVTRAEAESFEARRGALAEAVANVARSRALLQRELDVAQSMSGQGLMSEVEVMRVRRQLNDLALQTQERVNRFRQDASGEVVRIRTELALQDEQMVVRDDTLRRSTLTSPVRGVVRQIRVSTLGGVVAPGAPVMEILPLGEHVLVEARVRPADIGFVKVGQPVVIKLSAYEYTVYGALRGTVHSLSPDALGDPERAAAPDGTWYRALVRAEMPAVAAGAASAAAGADGAGAAGGGTAPAANGAPAAPAARARSGPPAAVRLGSAALPVLPGMTGTAEIRTGQRSVLAFLLQPMLKSREAFRER